MRGYTLIEVMAVLALMGIGASVLAPAARAQRDRAVVLEAREAIAALLVRTRALALGGEGASLHVDAVAGRAWITSGGSVTASLDLATGSGVNVLLGGGRPRTEIPFNGLGIGVFANETLEFSRGSSTARLIVSSYGRVRRE